MSILERKPLFSNASESSSDGRRHTCQKHGSLVLDLRAAMAWVGIGSQPPQEKISEVFKNTCPLVVFGFQTKDPKDCLGSRLCIVAGPTEVLTA